MMSYQDRREQLYQPLREKGTFTWDRMYGEEYALANVHLISKQFRRELTLATQQMGRIFTKVGPVLQRADDELLTELGIPKAAFRAVRTVVSTEMATVIGRFDFAATPEGLKMLEFNSDTPTGIVEAFHVNDHVCSFFGVEDPNCGMKRQLAHAFQQAVTTYGDLGYRTDNIYFSSLDCHEEDKGTTIFLQEQSGQDANFVPLEDLRVYQDRLYAVKVGKLQPVDVLYRLHALEKLAEERDTDGYPTGAHVLDLIARKKLAVINPPAAFITQTKALQALIWSLHEAGEFFTEEEHAIIAAYMLPTYFENRFLQNTGFVTKPIFGREGGGVVLYYASGEPIEQDQEEFYWEQPMIYQQLTELQPIVTETEKGPFQGFLLWGSFLIGGEASAIVARVGGRITNNMSYYLPVGMKS